MSDRIVWDFERPDVIDQRTPPDLPDESLDPPTDEDGEVIQPQEAPRRGHTEERESDDEPVDAPARDATRA